MNQQQIKEIANRCSLNGDEPWMAEFVGLVLEAVVAEIRNCFSRGGPPDDPHPNSVIYNNGVQSALEAVQEFAGQSLAPIPEQAVASLSAEDAAIIARQVFDWTKERDRLQDLIDTATGKSGAPIPEQVAQDPILATWPERIWLQWDPDERTEYPGASEDLTWCADNIHASDVKYVRADLATQSAKQSNLQEENRQLRERIEDLTTAANQCINDAIGQSAQEVTQQAAKVEACSVPAIRWDYCPECGSYETHEPHEGSEGHYFCAACNQEWYSHIDYTDVVRGHLSKRAPTTSTVSASGAQVKHGDVPSIEITLRQAKALVDCFGGHDAEISIIERPAAWADKPDGLYAYFSEYPEEGSMYLGPTEVDDDLAQNGDVGAQAAPDDVRNQAREDAKEAAEILDSFIDNVSTDGPYGAEATLTFISQAKQCIDGVIRALRTTSTATGADGSKEGAA